MNSPKSLIQPEKYALLRIDQQAGLAFGVASISLKTAFHFPCFLRLPKATKCSLLAMLVAD